MGVEDRGAEQHAHQRRVIAVAEDAAALDGLLAGELLDRGVGARALGGRKDLVDRVTGPAQPDQRARPLIGYLIARDPPAILVSSLLLGGGASRGEASGGEDQGEAPPPPLQ